LLNANICDTIGKFLGWKEKNPKFSKSQIPKFERYKNIPNILSKLFDVQKLSIYSLDGRLLPKKRDAIISFLNNVIASDLF